MGWKFIFVGYAFVCVLYFANIIFDLMNGTLNSITVACILMSGLILILCSHIMRLKGIRWKK